MEYVFIRAEGFYAIDIPDEILVKHGEAKCIRDNAELNPGTIEVLNTVGQTVWQLHKKN